MWILVDDPVSLQELLIDVHIIVLECIHVGKVDWNHACIHVVQLVVCEEVLHKGLCRCCCVPLRRRASGQMCFMIIFRRLILVLQLNMYVCW